MCVCVWVAKHDKIGNKILWFFQFSMGEMGIGNIAVLAYPIVQLMNKHEFAVQHIDSLCNSLTNIDFYATFLTVYWLWMIH